MQLAELSFHKHSDQQFDLEHPVKPPRQSEHGFENFPSLIMHSEVQAAPAQHSQPQLSNNCLISVFFVFQIFLSSELQELSINEKY